MILIRYGEIGLKSKPVRRRMETALVRSIRRALGGRVSLTVAFGRLFLETRQQAVQNVLRKIFGIVSFSPCVACLSTPEAMASCALEIAVKERFETFAVRTRRVGTHNFTSQDISGTVGALIQKTLGKAVNLTSPEKTFFIEIRDKKAYLFTEKIPGMGGFPLGTQGRVAAVLRNERDVLAAWLMMRRGCEIIPVADTNTHVKILEAWSFRSLNPYKNIDALLKKEHVAGIVSASPADASLKTTRNLPVYNPLSGLGEDEIRDCWESCSDVPHAAAV